MPDCEVVAGDGNGSPLQCSCLENSMDRGATVNGVAKTRTPLRDYHVHEVVCIISWCILIEIPTTEDGSVISLSTWCLWAHLCVLWLKKKKLKTGDFVLKPHLYKWQFIPTRNILFAHIEQQRMSMGLGRTSLLTPKQHCISALPNQRTDQCQKLLGWNRSQSGETVAKILEETWSVRDFHSCWA